MEGESEISTQLFSFQRSLPNKQLSSKKKKKQSQKQKRKGIIFLSIGYTLAGQIIKI